MKKERVIPLMALPYFTYFTFFYICIYFDIYYQFQIKKLVVYYNLNIYDIFNEGYNFIWS